MRICRQPQEEEKTTGEGELMEQGKELLEEETGEETGKPTAVKPSSTAVKPSPQSTELQLKESTGYVKCPVCGDAVTEQGKGTHFRNKHPDLPYEAYKDRFEPTPPPPEAKEKEKEEPTKPTGEPTGKPTVLVHFLPMVDYALFVHT